MCFFFTLCLCGSFLFSCYNFLIMPAVRSWFFIFSIIVLRYFLVAGLAFFIWYVVRKKKISFKKIQLRFPHSTDYKREILYSCITMFVFALVPYLILNTGIRKYTLFYTGIDTYGRIWFWSAFVVMLVLHDAYFYFTHRLIHHPKLFKTVHLLHHKSTNPSPWAAFAFHPLEALVEIGIVVLFVFCLPLSFYHLFFFFLVMMLYNVYGHLGWELYPKGFNKTKIGRWVNTSVNHNQHHQFFKGNYGLYFLWWDRWFKTIRADYDEHFRKVKDREKHF